MSLITRLKRLPRQLLGENPFSGTLKVERLPLIATALATARHFRIPLRILDFVFQGDGDFKYLDVPGFPPILFVRDPEAIRRAVEPQIEELADRILHFPTRAIRMKLESSIQALMLNVLVNVLFGSAVPRDELRSRYLPAIGNVIRYILLDTVANQFGLPVLRLPALTSGHARLKQDRLIFEELVDRVIRTRSEGAGFWPLLTAEGPEEALRSNVRVFLAGALEATSSYLGWALANLARRPDARAKAHAEAARTEISPEGRESATYLQQVLAETLRLNNALYFLPRIALRDTAISTSAGVLAVPAGTHLVLATYHAGRCERHWGVAVTGYPAAEFVPERWDAANMAARGRSSKDALHFGFGHGPRVCIGKHFSEAEAFVCLTLFLRRFEFRAVREVSTADAGVSTRSRDGVEVELSLRFSGPPPALPTQSTFPAIPTSNPSAPRNTIIAR